MNDPIKFSILGIPKKPTAEFPFIEADYSDAPESIKNPKFVFVQGLPVSEAKNHRIEDCVVRLKQEGE